MRIHFIDALVCLKTAIMPVKMQRERWIASALHPMHTVGYQLVPGNLTSFLRMREGEESPLLEVLVIVKMY